MTTIKKLGIIVPTYNRCVLLKIALDQLIPQIMANLQDVELIVTDNASSDGTEQMMRQYEKRYKGIVRYFRWEENGGYLFNFKKGIFHCSAEYIFLHGDDDLATPYLIEYLLQLINFYPDVDLFHFNYFISGLDGSDNRMIYRQFHSHTLIYSYSNLHDFLIGRYDIPSFMSSLLFRKNNWDNHVDDDSQKGCDGYEWLHILYKGCLNSKCIFVETPIFIQRMSSLESYSHRWAYYSIVGISRVFEHLGDSYYEGWKEYRRNYSKAKMLRNVASVYLDKTFYRKNLNLLIRYLDSPIYKVVLFICLYIFPTWLSDFLFNKAKKILM